MAEDFVLVEAAVLVLLPDDVVLPEGREGQFKTNHHSLGRTITMARVAVKTFIHMGGKSDLAKCVSGLSE